MKKQAPKWDEQYDSATTLLVGHYSTRVRKFLLELATELQKAGATNAEVRDAMERQIKKLEDLT
jgi:hypothetical protein